MTAPRIADGTGRLHALTPEGRTGFGEDGQLVALGVDHALRIIDHDPATAAALLIQAAAWAAAQADMHRTTALTSFLANYDVAALSPETGA